MREALMGSFLGALLATQSLAADKLTPDDIKTTFFNGAEFTAATPTGLKFKMVFTQDGKVTRTPAGNYGAKGEGTWKVDKDGFCTTWKGQQPNCYQVMANGQNKWSIMKASNLVAVWSK